jgi:hypothetical protein
MPQNLTGDTSTFPTQTAPSPGESRTAASVATPLQNAADRTAYLKDRLDYVDPTREGARRLRRFVSVAALKAVTDLPDKGVALIDGVALYEYDAASTATELSPAVITPTSVGVGAGRWIAVSFGNGALNVANGVPQLDANGRVPIARLAASEGGAKILPKNVGNGLVDTQKVSLAGPYTMNSLIYTDVGTASLSFDLAIGDMVFIVGQSQVWQQDFASASHYTQWKVTRPDTTSGAVTNSETKHLPAALGQYVTSPLNAIFTAVQAGVHVFQLQQRHDSGLGSTVGLANVNAFGLQIRP